MTLSYMNKMNLHCMDIQYEISKLKTLSEYNVMRKEAVAIVGMSFGL